MTYALELAPAAVRDLKRVPKDIVAQITQTVDALCADPRPQGCEKLEGSGGFLRVRCGDYRIIYQVLDEVLVVLVVRARHRREVYKDLSALIKRFR